ncbi:hypothetical protein AC578_10257 [Pseudocercospora eumusae]|uniref:Uncharacterized protein n=1 Tax=Pseudocercospora eumusae TaxID=321146 RepID=A0A139HYV7_9PEZI|nr:hypothetical protein AC578_10257 [Pseudocercospora eumusae]
MSRANSNSIPNYGTPHRIHKYAQNGSSSTDNLLQPVTGDNIRPVSGSSTSPSNAENTINASEEQRRLQTRSQNFGRDWEPFRHDPALECKSDSTSGAISWFNPTSASYSRARVLGGGDGPDVDEENLLPVDIGYKWTSRNNRKGRHTLVLTQDALNNPRIETPPRSGSWRAIRTGIQRMFTVRRWGNISWWVAITFTIGSVLWIISATLSLLSYDPTTSFPGQKLYGGGITAFIGSVVFVIGNIFLFLESFNDNRVGCFGWEAQPVPDGTSTGNGNEKVSWRLRPVEADCQHEHHHQSGVKSWLWLPKWRDVREHYIFEIGFIAAGIQVVSALIFFISGVASIPGISDRLTTPLMYEVYWGPKLVASCGFVVTGFLYTIETQKKWWRPAPRSLGWHIGAWKTIGGIGFLLLSCFGLKQAQWAQYQSAVHCVWGSWAFLISSVLRWYECLEQYPVEVLKSNTADLVRL